ncbi:MAG: hypothetical protein J6N72_06805, partial [Psychrobacter sp.]|nr:hypothetical protein [Psychrobacter sp.]
AGISKYIPLSDIDIEIKDTDIGFSIDQTIKNVLKINKEDVDLVAAYWPLYTYIHDREKRYTTDNKLLPINGGYFAGFIFAEERYFPFNSKALDKIKSESYLKENLTPALNRLERLVDGEFVGVILKKNGEKIRDSWFINKEETHLNSTIEYILGVALNQQIV